MGFLTAKDFFYLKCSILPFRKPSMPTQAEIDDGKTPFYGWAVNARCLDAFDIFDVKERRIYQTDVKVSDILTELAVDL